MTEAAVIGATLLLFAAIAGLTLRYIATVLERQRAARRRMMRGGKAG